MHNRTPSCKGVSTGSFNEGKIKGDASTWTGTLMAIWMTLKNFCKSSDPNLKSAIKINVCV